MAAATLRIQAMAGSTQVLAGNVKTILGNALYADSADLNLAGSMAALKVDHWDGAKTFWYRHLKATNATDTNPPRDTKELLTLWAKNLKRRGLLIRAGFPFDATWHQPVTAAECLLSILADVPED